MRPSKLRRLLPGLACLSLAAGASEIIECPAGATPRGSSPPLGHEIRCEQPDGTPHGQWVTWYESGKLMSRRQMHEGVEHGLQESWWPHGGRMMRGVSVYGNRYQGFEYWNPAGESVRMELGDEPRPDDAPLDTSRP